MVPASVAGEQVRGRYVMFGELASGGMGVVRLGRLVGPAGFARIVAIKELHPHHARDPDFVSMFIDEARLASRVRHPNVVSTLDVVVEAGSVFLVMDYVHGESLARLMRRAAEAGGPPPAPIAASILVGVLHGLHAAHEAKDERGVPLGIVHRDVSPQNIIVGSDGSPRVLDFGIAHASQRIHTTRDGSLKGKLAYMAPEQIECAPLDRRADVFAASVVLWEALTGARLFARDNPTQIMQDVCGAPIPPPSTLAPGIPAGLDAIVAHGLARELDRRFQTARAMAVAIENACSLATARQVGEWVEELAGRELALRNAEVSSVEAASAQPAAEARGKRISQAVTIVPADARPPAPPKETPGAASAWGPDGGQRTDPSASVRLPEDRGGPVVGLGLALAAAALGLVIYFGSRSAPSTAGQVSSTSPPASSEAIASAPDPPATAPPSPPASEAAPARGNAPPAPPGTASSGYPASTPSASSATAPRPTRPKPRPAPPAAPAPSCVPNYVMVDGIKHYKPECIQ